MGINKQVTSAYIRPALVMDPTLAENALKVIKSFEELLRVCGQHNVRPAAGSELSSLRSDLARLKAWYADVTTHEDAKLKGYYLEYRLRSASHIHRQLLQLLDSLDGTIRDAESIVSGRTVPWEELDYEEDLIESLSEGPQTEFQQIAKEICGIVDCLLRLRVATKDPAPHDRIISSRHRKSPEELTFDIDLIRKTWVETEEFLIERVGSSVYQRREELRQRSRDRTSSMTSELWSGRQPSDAIRRNQKAAESVLLSRSGVVKPITELDPEDDPVLSHSTSYTIRSIQTDVENLFHGSISKIIECPYCNITLNFGRDSVETWM